MGVPCGLLIYVPGDWEADPPALAELRRYLSDEYGVTLQLETATTPMLQPLALPMGIVTSRPDDRELRIRIDRAFFTLDWAALEDVS